MSSDSDEKRITVLENVWNQTQMSHDANAMASMLHSDFVFTDYDGTLMSKPAFLASIRDPSNKLSVEESNDMKLHRYGDTVVVTGATHEKARKKGRLTNTTGDSPTLGSSAMASGSASPANWDWFVE